jgi:hypothetical protein
MTFYFLTAFDMRREHRRRLYVIYIVVELCQGGILSLRLYISIEMSALGRTNDHSQDAHSLAQVSLYLRRNTSSISCKQLRSLSLQVSGRAISASHDLFVIRSPSSRFRSNHRTSKSTFPPQEQLKILVWMIGWGINPRKAA